MILTKLNKLISNLPIFSVRQRFYNWLQKLNEKYELLMVWWRYDNEGTPHRIGWKMFNGKLYIRYRNVV